MSRTLWTDEQGVVRTIDQTVLPFERREIALRSPDDCDRAIREMQVRGAPLIGAVGAYGLALALRADPSDASLEHACERLAAARPTAVNLRWALGRVRRRVAAAPSARRAALAWDEAGRICDEDVACNERIGTHGARLLRDLAARRSGRAGALQLLTHCNAGRIATVDYGTALAPIYRLHAEGFPVHVWVDETRPRNQGAALTAWELAERGVAHTVIADNAGGLLMMQGRVDAVIVGCDRVAANGDVANKVGTYLKALAARDNGVPFYVACPVSTIDPDTPDGASIPIEERAAREVTHLSGILDDGSRATVRVVPAGSAVANPAFDITPARLVTALVTERGVCDASAGGLRAVLEADAR
ncbi:MAG: S-methyl-5-thioribose-1-phosphate isomerase [Burkholderiaceae bacterium]|nr:S-methyl-5-thioribose-1-phosphate isomerase [Burkholderiaceae bacterium]